ncbi:MAG: TetR/AcrR family transcriptional regulator, partial [Gemmatimonadaceae bacterium]
HQRILQAAARVYAQHGWRGATTRRIAEEAGVNEVTLFRHFGSKDALLEQMMRGLSAAKAGLSLEGIPQKPELELLAWARAHHQDTSTRRTLIRQIMSDAEERPELVNCATNGPNNAATQLRSYVAQLRAHGFLAGEEVLAPAEVAAAVTMLLGAVFADGMNRDLMPAMFSRPVDETLRAYVRIFLRGLGALAEPGAQTGRMAAGATTLTSSST